MGNRDNFWDQVPLLRLLFEYHRLASLFQDKLHHLIGFQVSIKTMRKNMQLKMCVWHIFLFTVVQKLKPA